MLTFLSSVCSVSPEAAAASGAGLRKHWKGVVRFISPLLVHFKLSNSCQQKYGVIIRKTVLRNTDWVNLWMNLWMVCHKTMLLRIRMLFWVGVRKSLIFPSGYMQWCSGAWRSGYTPPSPEETSTKPAALTCPYILLIPGVCNRVWNELFHSPANLANTFLSYFITS